MRIEARDDNGNLLFLLSGSLGLSAYDAFARVLVDIGAALPRSVTIDLAGVVFIDSTGIGMLQAARDAATGAGACFAIVGAAGEVARTLDLRDQDGGDAEPLPVAIHADSALDAGDLAHCAAHGLAVGGTAGAVAVRYGAATADDLCAGLAPPWAGFLERGEDGLAGVGARCLSALRAGGVALSVLTRTACSIELAQVFEGAIRHRYPLGRRDSDGLISLCLAEAVSNAVIHGNLGIASSLRATRDGFLAFRGIMNDRLADPRLAGRRVEVTLHPVRPGSFTIAVSDRGDGFDFAAQAGRRPAADDKYGRGLSLMRKVARSVAAEDGGRTIVLSF